ncbi:MAG: hypothetical protein LC789_07845 [Actinobacteria bacterium]|nr:hypothetical protein [Actinomycetota bacterium]MCA1719655.1 hypothetical protein [Actinomycetota bacterium]
MDIALASSAAGLTFGVAASTLGFGLRHGADLDHIAALTDMASTSRDRRRSAVLSACYVAGHAAVLTTLGTVAILFGASLPAGVDAVMGRVVGATLVLLGVYVGIGLIRNGTEVRLRSRWMLLGDAARATGRAARTGARRLRSHRHPHDTGHHADVAARVRVGAATALADQPLDVHEHDHVHISQDTTSRRAALGIGALHGVGGETPTQVLLFITVAGVGGTGVGLLLLLVFLVGLVISNTGIALVAGLGIGGEGRSPKVFAVLAALTGLWSIVFGCMLLVGRGLGA